MTVSAPLRCGVALADLLCNTPMVTARQVEHGLGVSRATALRLMAQLAERGVLSEAEGGARGRRRYVAREMAGAIGEEGL